FGTGADSARQCRLAQRALAAGGCRLSGAAAIGQFGADPGRAQDTGRNDPGGGRNTGRELIGLQEVGVNQVEEYYDQISQREWERFDRHPTEFSVTQRALCDHLPAAPAKILDIGGGPGRYAIWLTQKGYTVTLLDLSRQNLALARSKSSETGLKLEAVMHGNALDLSAFPDESFDVVLLMGPLYHLVKEEERRRAIFEARRVLKTGGRLFVAFICRFAIVRYDSHALPLELMENPQFTTRVLENGINDGALGFTEAYLAHPDEIQPLMESCGLRMLDMVGVEGIVAGHEEGVNALNGPAWEYWVDLNYRLGRDSSLRGASDHILYIGEK
ncbi:methyltransferase domain-containing protein, partial [bacterium]